MQLKRSAFGLLNTAVLLLCLFSAVYAFQSIDKKLKERVKNAKKLEDVFMLEKIITLEGRKDSFVSSVYSTKITSSGDILIISMNSGKTDVLIFDKNGKFIKTLGRKGNGPGEYLKPVSLAEDSDGNIYLVDTDSRKIHIYNNKYIYRESINYYCLNRFIHLDSKKNMYLYLGVPIPEIQPFYCIVKYNRNGKKLAEFASLPEEVNKQKYFIFSDCIAIDNSDNIFESNAYMPYVRKYTSNGEIIKDFGEKYVRLVNRTDKKGNSYEFPRSVRSLLIHNGIIIMAFDDNKMDCYDLEGNLLNKNLKFSNEIVYANDRAIYFIEHNKNMDNPIIYKYIDK